ncbi:ribonucleases p mrp protein subunit pop1 containing protein [Stylonychia lemnae]|uniref:Ribonucleases p mrp protein subunit pop1 containing protein n=1 Tax=Stylonychia lemnae TaxID=5949 RepID=A0A078B890_STYLE|nr:ribonucleases p mrp protein subunit pop1 containing protein [Stylonychia lemnae]|eukprot:CDW89507.1 ribonucleases p mrp protein subunit pop1 containing protein [Stylonychia lemnae]
MRDKRKDLYQINNDPYLKSIQPDKTTGAIPQFINIHKFLESRAYELRHFTNILQNKYTSKLEHQLLPKHMRRRAMAHNYYRIPLRIRFKSLMEIQPSEPEILSRSRCRKHRRKLRFLLNQYEMRQRQHKWTESHVWHAKRFRMKEFWGYKVAYKSNDKSGRTVYRLCQRNSACIYDQSYMQTLMIEGQEHYNRIIKSLDLKECNQVQVRWINNEYSQPEFPLTFVLFKEQRQVLVTFHPANVVDAQNYFKGRNYQFSNLNMNTLQIMSQNCSIQHIFNVLEPLCDEESSKSIQLLSNMLFDQTRINNNEILVFNVKTEELKKNFRMNERVFNYESAAINQQNQTQAQEELRQQINLNGMNLKPIKWIGTQRTTFTHRKDNQRNKIKHLIVKLKKMKEQHDSNRAEKLLKLNNKIRCQNNDNDLKMKDETESETLDYTTVIIYKNQYQLSNNFGASFQILIPQGYGLNLLRRFVYSGCKPIGLKEYLAINMEVMNPVYPFDYLQTQTGQKQGVVKAHQDLEIYCKRPASKRINYQVYNFSNPFLQKFKLNQAQKFINLFSYSRGVAQSGAMIFLPDQNDIIQLKNASLKHMWNLEERKFETSSKNKKFNFEYALISGNCFNLSKNDLSSVQKIKNGEMKYDLKIFKSKDSLELQTSEQLKRKSIGYITRGAYSQIRGKSIGIGLVEQNLFNEYKIDAGFKGLRLNGNGYLLLIRNANSLRYLPFICYDK